VLLTAAELTMPDVLLTEAHAAACRVKVGDTIPDVSLPDLTGREQTLSKLLGEKLTVVVFWTGSHAYAVQELGDLGPDIVAPYGSLGVKVVAINEQDTPEAAKQMAEKAAANFPILIDAQGAALAAVGTQKLPRTYLLDSAGKILWFDIEYSRSTRRELQRAIRSTLNLQ
jgi:peroxiredoxin